MIVHCRDAHEDTARLIGAHPGVRGVMHCYTMGEAELAPYLEAGFYISFSGIVTFKNAKEIKAVAQAVPLDRMLIETDNRLTIDETSCATVQRNPTIDR